MSATWNPEWNAFLGKEKDKALARRLGVSRSTVTGHRTALGIPRFLVDHSGERHGRWVVVRRLHHSTYEARCDCGRVAEVVFGNLAHGLSTGCVRCGYEGQTKFKPGVRVGNQEIVDVTGSGARRRYYVRCGGCGRVRKLMEPPAREHCDDCKPSMPIDTHGELVTINGETHNLSAWAKKLGISRQALHLRIANGWPIERALTEPRSVA